MRSMQGGQPWTGTDILCNGKVYMVDVVQGLRISFQNRRHKWSLSCFALVSDEVSTPIKLNKVDLLILNILSSASKN